MQAQGATALAEGGKKFKVDVDLIFNNLKTTERKFILRTVFDDLSVWKSKYFEANVSLKKARYKTHCKDCALIDGEIWVFRIDATSARDIVTAVQIAAQHYKIKPDILLRDIYIKNMNAECENDMGQESLIKANKSLYTRTCDAIREAGNTLGIRGELKLHVFSNNKNPKIPQSDLHDALSSGNSDKVETDSTRYQYPVSKNDNTQDKNMKPLFTHHHVAIIDL